MDDSNRNCKCKDREIVIPIPKKKLANYEENSVEKFKRQNAEKNKNSLKDIKEVDMLKVNMVDLPFEEKVPTEMYGDDFIL